MLTIEKETLYLTIETTETCPIQNKDSSALNSLTEELLLNCPCFSECDNSERLATFIVVAAWLLEYRTPVEGYRFDHTPSGCQLMVTNISVKLLVNKDFHTWLLIGWQHTCQSIRSHVRKCLSIKMDFNIAFS